MLPNNKFSSTSDVNLVSCLCAFSVNLQFIPCSVRSMTLCMYVEIRSLEEQSFKDTSENTRTTPTLECVCTCIKQIFQLITNILTLKKTHSFIVSLKLVLTNYEQLSCIRNIRYQALGDSLV